MELTGRIALVTGGGTGLGRAISLALARAGCDVAVNYARSADDAEATAAEVRALGRRSLAVQADVADAAAVSALVAAVEGGLGPIDVLVNNAAVTKGIPFADLAAVAPEDWQAILGVNLVGSFLCTQAVVPGMAARGAGSVLMVSSNAPYVAMGSSIPYTVSKAGLLSLTQCLCRAVPEGIRVNAIAPGWMRTRWLERNLDPELLARVESGELPSVDVDDVARAAVEVIANDAANGQTLVLDGGELWRT